MTRTLFGTEVREIKPYNRIKGIQKPVLQIKDGVVVNRFSSIGEAGRMTNISSSGISHVVRGKNNTIGGYVWKYAEYDMPQKTLKSKKAKVSAIKKVKKGPFKVIITELCDTEDDAKALLNSLIGKNSTISAKNARIIQTRHKK